MAASLDGVMLKIERAGIHLVDVRRIVEDLSKRPLDAISFQRNDETSETIIRLEELPTPDPHIGVVIGDCAHNLRSALDNLAWQLVKHPARPVKETSVADAKIAFPIYCGKKAYSPKTIRGSTPQAQAIIKGLQPYHAGERALVQPLALVRELSNWDKHRVIHTVANTLTQSRLRVGQEHLEAASVRPPGPLVAGAELARYRLRPNTKVSVAYQAAFGVAFRDGPATGLPVEDTLADGLKAVLGVVVNLFNELAVDGDSMQPPKWARFV